MGIFGRFNPGNTGAPVARGAARLVGRVLLWGCVVLLLVRGIASYLDSDPRQATARGAGTAVTQQSPDVVTAPRAGR
jgi:hypothetical protein